MNIAAAFAVASTASITLAAIFVVLQAVAGNSRAVLRQHSAHLLQALLQRVLGAVQFRRALEYAVGKIREVFFHPGYAEVQINFVVIGSDIAVADRPILPVAISAFGLEIVVGEAQRQASPDVCFSAETACANPCIVRPGVGILSLVDNDVLHIVAVADIAVQMLGFFKARTVGRPADGVLVESEGM